MLDPGYWIQDPASRILNPGYRQFSRHKLSSKGRTEAKIGPSKTKNCVEFHGNLRFSIGPQKALKKLKRLIFKSFFFVQKFASKYFRGRKFASENIVAGGNSRPEICSRAEIRVYDILE